MGRRAPARGHRVVHRRRAAARSVATALSDEYGIGVRDGKFCAHPFVRRLLGDGGRLRRRHGPALRASFGIGTTDEHIDRLVEALRDLATRTR